MNPINAIGAISLHSGDNEIFLGTAFCYKSPRFLLTAAHVFPDDLSLISVTFPYAKKVLIPTKMAKHDEADVVALACEEKHINNRSVDGIEFFTSLKSNLELAGDYITYGYPEDISLTKGPTPTPRVFKGYFQRLFLHESNFDYKYSAIELSTPCPKGLSGAPVMVFGNASQLAGLVAESIETSNELHVEEAEGSETYVYRRVINYGVAVNLATIENWIEEHYVELDS
jgi:hypothetical protein